MLVLRSLGPALLVLLSGTLPVAADNANSSYEHGSMHGEEPVDESVYPPTYFSHGEHVAVIYSHIALMVLAWVFVLPVGK